MMFIQSLKYLIKSMCAHTCVQVNFEMLKKKEREFQFYILFKILIIQSIYMLFILNFTYYRISSQIIKKKYINLHLWQFDRSDW